jgi:hypothetical protein
MEVHEIEPPRENASTVIRHKTIKTLKNHGACRCGKSSVGRQKLTPEFIHSGSPGRGIKSKRTTDCPRYTNERNAPFPAFFSTSTALKLLNGKNQLK